MPTAPILHVLGWRYVAVSMFLCLDDYLYHVYYIPIALVYYIAYFLGTPDHAPFCTTTIHPYPGYLLLHTNPFQPSPLLPQTHPAPAPHTNSRFTRPSGLLYTFTPGAGHSSSPVCVSLCLYWLLFLSELLFSFLLHLEF